MFSMRARWRGDPVGLWLVLLVTMAGPGVAAQDAPQKRDLAGPEPRGDASEEPPPIDIDTAVSKLLAKRLATPRFEDEVVVIDRYQAALDAHLKAAALGCQVARSGPPQSHEEMSRYSANPKPPSADLLTPTKMLFGKVKGLFSGKEPRFFVYSVRREDAPERVVYVVLDGRVSASLRHSVPGTTWEMLAKFSDRGEAAEALSRLQQGNAATPDRQAAPSLWAATGC